MTILNHGRQRLSGSFCYPYNHSSLTVIPFHDCSLAKNGIISEEAPKIFAISYFANMASSTSLQDTQNGTL